MNYHFLGKSIPMWFEIPFNFILFFHKIIICVHKREKKNKFGTSDFTTNNFECHLHVKQPWNFANLYCFLTCFSQMVWLYNCIKHVIIFFWKIKHCYVCFFYITTKKCNGLLHKNCTKHNIEFYLRIKLVD